jgi:chromosomal replication initiation ATPase DnaA
LIIAKLDLIDEKESNQNNFILSQEALEYLSSSIEGNIRELEGVLNSIICQTQLKMHLTQPSEQN